MPNHNNEGEHDGEPTDSDSFGSRSSRFFARVRLFQVRDLLWRLLDAWEEKPRFKWSVCGVALAGALVAVIWIWINPWWSERTAIGVARQWLESGRLDRASESVQRALVIAPGNPVVWQMASELAGLSGNKVLAMNHAHRAAEVSKWELSYVLGWAAAAILADKLDDADKAMELVPAPFVDESSLAQRIKGELYRRRGRLSEARDCFEVALKLDGPVAVDEVPLGIILLQAKDAAVRNRGLSMLQKYTEHPEFGAAALRALLADALVRNDTPQMLKWGQALRRNAGCLITDIPNCLGALSRADEQAFKLVLVELQKAHATDANFAALLMGWLNQIGRAEEALSWARTLPNAMTSLPPLAVSVAETLRQLKNWRELKEWIQLHDFGEELQFMGWAYGLCASIELSQQAREQELWNTLKAHCQSNGAHALFAANALYSWGLHTQAVNLFKIAVEVPGAEIQALGALARHYQVQRDASGQYDAFRRLYSLRSHDADISNNYAYFSAVMDKDSSNAERLARDNVEHHPDNLIFRSTLAFVLGVKGSYAEAHDVLRPVEKQWKESEGIAFAYGLILAKTGKKDEARVVLATLDAGTLTKQEAELLAKLLK